MNLVMPPSVSNSQTMSAFDSPDCGRAAVSFGIRTTTGRLWIASALAASVPRSGQYTGGAGVGGAVGVGVAVATGEVFGVGCAVVALQAVKMRRKRNPKRRTKSRTSRGSSVLRRASELVREAGAG